MGTTLHILNSRGQFDGMCAQIEREFVRGLSVIERLIPVVDVDVVVYCDPRAVIPETGIGGHCFAQDRVSVAIDPTNPYVRDCFEVEFLATLGHELHHCARRMGPGYGDTLLETLVSEGLACSFESAELRSGEVPFYARALSPAQLEEARAEAMQIGTIRAYDHAEWFYGKGRLPRHAGYALGFDIVSRHIASSGTPASRLVHASAEDFYAKSP